MEIIDLPIENYRIKRLVFDLIFKTLIRKEFLDFEKYPNSTKDLFRMRLRDLQPQTKLIGQHNGRKTPIHEILY